MQRQVDEAAAARRLAQRQAADATAAAAEAAARAEAVTAALAEAREDNSDAARCIMQLEDELRGARALQDTVQRSSHAEAEAATAAQLALQRHTAASSGSLQQLQRQLQAAESRQHSLEQQLVASQASERRLEQLLRQQRAAGAVHPPAPPQLAAPVVTLLPSGTHVAAGPSTAAAPPCTQCARLRRQLAGRSAKVAALQDGLLALREAATARTAGGGVHNKGVADVAVNYEGMVPRDAVAKLLVMTQDAQQSAGDRWVALDMLAGILELSSSQLETVRGSISAPRPQVAPFGPRPASTTSDQSLADEWVQFLGGGGGGMQGTTAVPGQP